MGSGGSIFRRRGLNSALALVTALTTFLVATPEPARAATLTVNNNVACSGAADPYCTIQQAHDAASPGDTIQVAAGTYPEELTVNTNNLLIVGAGAGLTFITAATTGSGQHQIIENGQNLTISDVTITGGDTDDFGTIYNAGVLTIVDAVITGNSVSSHGGAIYNNVGQLNLTRTNVSANSAGGDGGGVYNTDGASAVIIDSIIDGNSAVSGAGIYHRSNAGNLVVSGSAIVGNQATFQGGGIWMDAGANAVSNSTIAQNSTNGGGVGGGLLVGSNAAMTVTINNVTVSENFGSQGGGIWANTATNPATIANSIFYGNIATVGAAADCSGGADIAGPAILGVYNCTTTGTGSISTADPLLAPLGTAGGTTTHHYAPMSGSPAINAGSGAVPGSGYPACEATDQLGATRPVDACDLGSIEFLPSATPLQDLIDAAPDGSTIDLPPGIYNESIEIDGGKTLEGAGPALTFIDGNSDRTVDLTGDATLRSLTIRNGGNSEVNGGNIRNLGHSLTLDGVEVDGGGGYLGGNIYSTGSLVMTGSTVRNGSAYLDGGGIYASGSSSITNSYLLQNDTETGDGGAFFLDSETSATLNNVVVLGNTASNNGGGVYVANSSSLAATDTVFENNLAYQGAGIYTTGSLSVSGGAFTNNDASTGGGIFQAGAASPLNINSPTTCTVAPDVESFVPLTTFDGNDANDEGGADGGAIFNSSVANIYGTLFTGNQAENGGAIYEDSGADLLTVGCSAFELNSAWNDGGAISADDDGSILVEDTLFVSNVADGFGGAIGPEFDGNPTEIRRSIFVGNQASAGGAIHAQDSLIVDESTINGNTAVMGGGLYVGGSDSSIFSSTISNNSATGTSGTVGGGILVEGDLRIVNSTISGNSSAADAGGLGVTGGSEFSPGGNVTVSHATFAQNSAAGQGGALNATTFADITIGNSVSAGNTNGTGGPNCVNLTSVGYNIVGGAAGCTLHPTDSTAPASIGPLADNGGPTLTHLPQPGSPAIDGGGPTGREVELATAINNSQISLNGSATTSGGELVLTPSATFAVGTAWASALDEGPFDLGGSFSTTFDFQITDPVVWSGSPASGSGDGFAFAVSPSSTLIGEPGGRLGVAGTPATGVLSVGFKTYGGNLLGISVSGASNGQSVIFDTAVGIPGDFDDGGIWTSWIDYDGNSDLLEIRVAADGVRPATAQLSYMADIAAEVGDTGYYGFGAATGSAYARHAITAWDLYTEPCPLTDQRGLPRPVGAACDIGAVELQSTTIPTELTVEIDQLAAPVGSSVIPITDLNVGTFFGATEGPSSTQLGAIQLGAIQLGAIQLGAIGLADAAGHMTIGSIIDAANEITAAASPTVIPTILDEVTLVDVPVVGGWDPILAGTSLEGRPSYTVTLQQVIDVLVNLDLLRDLRIAESGVTASQLGAIQLGAIQLGAIDLSAIQLGAIQLGAIGDQLTALCAEGLDCAALGINPANSNSFDDYSIMALTLMGVDLDFAQLGAIQLGAIDPSGTQLGAIQLGAIQLGAIQLGAIGANEATIGNTQLGAIQLGAIQLGAIQLGAINKADLVADFCASGLDCSELGLDPAGPFVGDELDGYSLLALGAMGADLLSTQLGAIQLGAIQLGAIGDLESTQLGAIQLGAIQLGAIDPGSTQLGAIQLGAIGPDPAAYATQLGAIQLGAIDFNNPVFAQLGAIQLGAIQLGAIASSTQLGAIQLGAIQLGAIANPSAIISCGSLSGGCSANGLMTLGELQALGLILPTATLADLEAAIADIPLADLAAAGFDIVAIVGSATLLDLLPETTIADLPPGLTLGQLAELWVGMPVFELLLALLNPGELSWEDVDPAVLASQHPAVTGWSVDFAMAGEPGAVAGAEFPFTAEATVNLPSGMEYVAGSALISVDGATATPLSDPEQDGNALQWVIDGLTLNSSRVITFDLGTAFTADTTTPVATTVNTIGYTATDTAPTIVLDVEPNDTFGTATLIGGDVVVLGRIGTETDVDMFRINVPPGATIEAYLNPGGVDLDLVLFEPGQTSDGELRGPAERIVDGSLDPTIGIDPAEQDQESLADIANTDLAPVFKASLHRSTANEAIVTPPLREGGDFFLQISGYNGATPESVYVSRIRVIDPPALSACAPRPSADAGSWSIPALPSPVGLETLYLMNTELFRDTFGDADTDAVLDAIALVQGVPGVPAGAVVPVEGDAAVAAAYANWLGASGNCSVDAANVVASAIGDLVDGYRAGNPDIANIVIVGGDDQIPFFRVKDQGIVANEREYRSTFTGNNPLVAALGDGTVMTDAPYSDPNPLYVPQGDREVFIPQLPTGRLVDQPVEILAALAQFVAANGELETVVSSTEPAPAAQVLGYDFLSDSSATIAASLTSQGFDVTSTVSETWDKLVLKGAMDAPSAIVNANAHFDHTAALPAAGNLTNTFTNLYQLADLLPPSSGAYDGKIIFSMGCHGGTNAADSYLATTDPVREWAQELLLRDAVFVGNTGFGYGDSDFEAYSEELMSLFAQKIETSNTIGEAFVAAQQTMAGKTPKWSPYHDKSQMEATLYGLPFYRLHESLIVAPPNPTISTTADGTGLQSAVVNASAAITQVSATDGDYLVADDVLAVPFRPVQPLELINVTPQSANLRAAGAIIESGSSSDLANFDVLFARPILYNEFAEPEIETTGAFPNALQAITSFDNPSGTVDQLLLARGRYFPSTSTQQRWDAMGLTVYYVPDTVADVAPPTISRVSAVEVAPNSVDFVVEADDASGVLRVVVLYKTAGTTGAWTKLELGSTGGPWTGNAALTAAQNVDFFVQVLGGDGQVAVSTDKAEMHQVLPPGPPVIQVTGAVGNNGIYKSPAQVALVGPANAPGAALEYSVDSGPFSEYTGPFALTDGTYTVRAQPAIPSASLTSKTIVVDATAPTVTIENPIVPGVKLELDSIVPLQYFCGDTGSGIAKCQGTVGNGASLPTNSVGLHVAQVTATDKAGNTFVQLVPYEVVPEGPMTLTADQSLVPVDTTVTFTATYSNTGGSHTVEWDFDGDGDFSDDPLSTSSSTSGDDEVTVATFAYAETGVYPVSVRVAHGTGFVQTEVLTYIVVYDPAEGFVTGGGWFNSPSGAYTPGDSEDPDIVGKAHFGFVSKYKKGASVPTGNTSFELKAGDLDFESTSYEWMVISGKKAQYKGVGLVEGWEGEFNFRLTVMDADVNPNDQFDKDTFRIEIWRSGNGPHFVLYDNGLGADPSTDQGTTELGGGSIKIHSGKSKKK